MSTSFSNLAASRRQFLHMGLLTGSIELALPPQAG
jgi:hypothetical protein